MIRSWWRNVRARQDEAEALAVEETEARWRASLKPPVDEEPLFDWKRYEQELPFTAEHIAAQVARKQESLRRLNRRQP